MPTIAEDNDVDPPTREDVKDVEPCPKIIFYAGGRLMPDNVTRAPKGGVYVSPPKWLNKGTRHAGGRLLPDNVTRAPKGGIWIKPPEQEAPPAEATSSSHPVVVYQ